MTVLPDPLIEPLKRQIEQVRIIHEEDTSEGFGEVYLPFALERKYPNAAKALGWQYLFPTDKRSRDLRSGKTRRHHLGEGGFSEQFNRLSGTRVSKSLPPVTLYGTPFA